MNTPALWLMTVSTVGQVTLVHTVFSFQARPFITGHSLSIMGTPWQSQLFLFGPGPLTINDRVIPGSSSSQPIEQALMARPQAPRQFCLTEARWSPAQHPQPGCAQTGMHLVPPAKRFCNRTFVFINMTVNPRGREGNRAPPLSRPILASFPRHLRVHHFGVFRFVGLYTEGVLPNFFFC